MMSIKGTRITDGYGDGFGGENEDQSRFMRNCPPTPPLSQHFALSEK